MDVDNASVMDTPRFVRRPRAILEGILQVSSLLVWKDGQSTTTKVWNTS